MSVSFPLQQKVDGFRGHLEPSSGILPVGESLGAPAEGQKQLKSTQLWFRAYQITGPFEVDVEAPFTAVEGFR